MRRGGWQKQQARLREWCSSNRGACGGARDDSDLDFLVIEAQVESKLDEMVRLRDAVPPLGVPVDVVVVSEKEASRRERVPSTLVHRALREGRVLVAACT